MKLITICIPEEELKLLKQLVELKLYSNLTELIRIALRDYLWQEIMKL